MTIKRNKTLSHLKKLYDSKVLPMVIDKVCALDSISQQRRLVVPKASGVVLEVGVGSGHNAKFYTKQQITRVIGVDPHMHPKVPKRFENAGISFESQPLSAEVLPLEDNSVDSVVMMFTLCSIPDPLKALKEIKRVLKADGKLYYAEHGLAPQPKVINKFQKFITPAWQPLAGGCHLDRNIEQLISSAGFKVSGEQGFTQSVSVVGHHYWGEASKKP